MFDQLFERPAARERHLNSPLLKERLDYLRFCWAVGYKPSALRQVANHLLRIQNLAKCEPGVAARVRRWSEDQGLMKFLRNL